ncbi:hypothetical protein CAter282_0242 [Collimonas arenae]|uniref:Uncharacterized protein n=1 Tax=Collimonas arenae TaxID=279058 RepID=A0A127QDG0_9BURK|nr:hypothetical protein CAter10_0256 [Collimonas arenae]AMP08064.1 hypothetical protein CAter282_0242 [Collimonas arenae]
MEQKIRLFWIEPVLHAMHAGDSRCTKPQDKNQERLNAPVLRLD